MQNVDPSIAAQFAAAMEKSSLEAEEAGKEGLWDKFSTKEIMEKRVASLPQPAIFDVEAAIKDAFEDQAQQACLLKIFRAM